MSRGFHNACEHFPRSPGQALHRFEDPDRWDGGFRIGARVRASDGAQLRDEVRAVLLQRCAIVDGTAVHRVKSDKKACPRRTARGRHRVMIAESNALTHEGADIRQTDSQIGRAHV